MGRVARLVEDDVTPVDAAGEHVVGAAGGADATDAAVAGFHVQTGNLTLVDAILDLGFRIGGSHDAGETGGFGGDRHLVGAVLDEVEVLAVRETYDTGHGKTVAAIVGVDGVLGRDGTLVHAVLDVAGEVSFRRIHLAHDAGQALAGGVLGRCQAHRGLVRTAFYGGVERESGHAADEGHRGALSFEDGLRADDDVLHGRTVEDAEEACRIACGGVGRDADLEVVHGVSPAVKDAREGDVTRRDDTGVGHGTRSDGRPVLAAEVDVGAQDEHAVHEEFAHVASGLHQFGEFLQVGGRANAFHGRRRSAVPSQVGDLRPVGIRNDSDVIGEVAGIDIDHLVVAVCLVSSELATHGDAADGGELAEVGADEALVIADRGDDGTRVPAAPQDDAVIVEETDDGAGVGVGFRYREVSVVHETVGYGILVEDGNDIADTAVGESAHLVGVVRTVQEVATEVGRGDDTGRTAQLCVDFSVVHAVFDIVRGVILRGGNETGDTAVHGTGGAVGRVLSAICIDDEVGRAVLDGAGAASRIEHEAGDAAQGEAFRVSGTGGSDLSADFHVLDRGGNSRSHEDAGVCLTLGGNVEVGLDVQVPDGRTVQYAEEAEGAVGGNLDGRLEAPDGMAAAIEHALEGDSGVGAGIVAVADSFGIADGRPLLAFGQVDVGEQFDFLGSVLPAGRAFILVHSLDELQELIHVRNAPDTRGGIVRDGVAELGDGNDVGLAATGEDDLAGSGSDIRLVVDVRAFYREADDGIAAAKDGIGLDPGRCHDDPVCIGRQVQDLLVRIHAGHLVQGCRI